MSRTVLGSSDQVRATIRVAGLESMIERVAVTPSMSGIRTSMSTTSGLRSLARETASFPPPASPTTSIPPSSESASRSMVRVLEESSTTITRTVFVICGFLRVILGLLRSVHERENFRAG